MNAHTAAAPMPTTTTAYRFLTGCAGAVIVFVVTQTAAMLIPGDGSIVIKTFLQIGGTFVAIVTPFRSILGGDVTYGGVVSQNNLTP